MKIWYQSLTHKSLFGAYQEVLASIVNEVKDPGTQIDIHSIKETGGLGKQFHYLEYLQTAEVLENVEKAVEQGYDAFVIGHFTDSGLQEAREIASIPVLGLGESSMLMACMMGKRFSLVGINQKSLGYIEEKIRAYGLEQRLASMTTMKLPGPSVLEEALANPQARKDILASFDQAAHICEQNGGEVIIAAGGVAMAVLATAGIHATSRGASVLNGIAAVVKASEMAVRMNHLMDGCFTSKSLSYAAPLPGEMEQIRQYYGNQVYRTLETGRMNNKSRA
jgi:allantoin racemase